MSKHKFFKNSKTFATTDLEIEGLGTIHLRELSALDMANIQKLNVGEMEIAGHIAATAIRDDQGNRVFKPSEVEEFLDNITMKDMTTISEAVMKLSNLGDNDEGKSQD